MTREHIAPLPACCLPVFNREFAKRIAGLTAAAGKALPICPWPGNVCELTNVEEEGAVGRRG